MAGRLAEDARAVLDAAALRIGGAVVEPAEARERDGGGAHRARLQRHVEVAADQPLGAERGTGGADHQQLGVGRGVVQLARAIARRGQQRPVRANHDRPDRDLAALCRRFRFG